MRVRRCRCNYGTGYVGNYGDGGVVIEIGLTDSISLYVNKYTVRIIFSAKINM